jgi:hypothetical protein
MVFGCHSKTAVSFAITRHYLSQICGESIVALGVAESGSNWQVLRGHYCHSRRGFWRVGTPFVQRLDTWREPGSDDGIPPTRGDRDGNPRLVP